MVAVLIPKIKTVLAYTLPITFAFFIVSLLDSVIGAENIRLITPFKYFDISYIVLNNAYEWKYVIIDLVFVAVCVIATYVIYYRKDIQAPA
jgi:ABC-2 type transport system permease protein